MKRARGAWPLNGYVWMVIADYLYLIAPDGSISATFGPFENNNLPVYGAANPDQFVFITQNKAYYVQNASLQPVPWLVDVEVIDVGFINQYFVFLAVDGDGFYYSEPGDVTQGDTTNFISAEASANKYLRLLVNDQRIWLQGGLISQVFYDQSAIDPVNPFTPDLSGVIEQGTAAPAASTKLDNGIFWLGLNSAGGGIAWRNNGYQPVRISTFAVENAWRKYATVNDAWGYTVTIKGHTFWRVWFPDADVTWQYDAALPPNLGWSRIGYLNPQSGKIEADRGSCAASFGQKILVGDRQNGEVYELSLDALSDDGDAILCRRRAPIISNENKMVSYPWFELDMETGVGDGSNLDPDNGDVTPEANPHVMMRYSNDWGKTWSNQRTRSMGTIGEFGKRVIWTRNGTGRQRVFEVSISANVRVLINNAYLRDPLGRTT